MSSMATGVGEPWRVFKFVHDWAERPFFRGAGEAEHGAGHFQGRSYELEQLTQFFVEGSGGTALVSGFRGVGKTATVDRALIEALGAIKIENGTGKEGTDRTSRRETLLRGRPGASDLTEAVLAQLRPKRLIALKLDFGQIAILKPASAAPRSGQSTTAQNGKAQPTATNQRWAEVDPRQVLIEIIKGLHRNLVEGRRFDADEKRALGQLARLQAMAYLAKKRSAGWRLLRALHVHYLARFFWPRHSDFWNRLTEALDQAMVRAYHQSYREEYAQGVSHEWVSGVTRKWNVEFKKLFSLLLVSGLFALGLWYGLSAQTLFSGLQSNATAVASFVALIGITGTATVSTSRTMKKSDAIKVVYSRDSSLASLKRDLEEIISLLEGNEAPIEFRLVVVLDELDKLQDPAMLDGVIQSFKNLFTLTRVTFLFVTDRDYFDHITQQQQEAAKLGTYAPHHTFFTRKIFLTKPDFDDVKEYLNAVNADLKANETNSLWVDDWTQTVRYLTFASRCHYFDLISLLNELVQASPPPTLELKYDRLGRVELRRYAYVQRMIELVYAQHRYGGHQQSDANTRLLGELYGVFDDPPLPVQGTGRANGRSNYAAAQREKLEISEDEKAKQRKAREQLKKLMADCAVAAAAGQNGSLTLHWNSARFREPRPEDLELDERYERAIEDLGKTVRGWVDIEKMLVEA